VQAGPGKAGRPAGVMGVLRPRQWAHMLPLPLAGIDPGAPGLDWRAALALGSGVLAAACCMAFAYGLNAIADRATDADPRKNPLAGVATVTWAHRALVGAAAVLALGLVAPRGAVPLAAVLASLVSGLVYSAGPRLKRLPVLGTVANAGIFAPLLLLGGRDAAPPPGFPVLLVVFVGALLQNQLLHEVADQVEDARGGVRSSGALLGERATLLVIGLVAVAGAAACAGLARSTPVALAAAAVLGLGVLAGALLRLTAARRRVVHRVLVVCGGAVLYATVALAGRSS
jgi:4-hydroxybenzoate polyprenyltransferase